MLVPSTQMDAGLIVRRDGGRLKVRSNPAILLPARARAAVGVQIPEKRPARIKFVDVLDTVTSCRVGCQVSSERLMDVHFELRKGIAPPVLDS